MSTESKSVQLVGEKLEEMRALQNRAEKDLLKLGHATLRHIYGDAAPARIRSLRLVPNNSKVGVYDENLNLIGVWEDPPGVCRSPRAGETVE
jgi:hypothetical protein